MPQTNTLTNYDKNAADFDHFRQPSSIIAAKLGEAFFASEGPILSLGCGTGKYEAILSNQNLLIGIDKSQGMIFKAKRRIRNALLGDMTALPFARESFSGAYFMQSLHHVGANLKIQSEYRNDVRRNVIRNVIDLVSHGPIFIVQRDPIQNQAVWFWKYFPRAMETKIKIQPKISMLVEWLNFFGLENVIAEPIHDPMIRGFYDPTAPLDPGFRRSFSEFSYLTSKDMQNGVELLKSAIEDGSVMENITKCKLRFAEIGGTVFTVSGEKK